ncbi:hypothetical protein ASE05_32375 [Mesorhizobium sp. Root172]|nr:hypothetical protein ASE05_32375 [Mesorhizobium sp. Root172]
MQCGGFDLGHLSHAIRPFSIENTLTTSGCCMEQFRQIQVRLRTETDMAVKQSSNDNLLISAES